MAYVRDTAKTNAKVKKQKITRTSADLKPVTKQEFDGIGRMSRTATPIKKASSSSKTKTNSTLNQYKKKGKYVM